MVHSTCVRFGIPCITCQNKRVSWMVCIEVERVLCARGAVVGCVIRPNIGLKYFTQRPCARNAASPCAGRHITLQHYSTEPTRLSSRMYECKINICSVLYFVHCFHHIISYLSSHDAQYHNCLTKASLIC